MSEMMTFPDTWEEFEKSYGFTDNEEVYTNGVRLIPSFRVKQWLDHLPSVPRKGKWINAYPDIEPNPMFMYGICSVCGYKQAIFDKLNFCPNCGADMREGNVNDKN